ncbi:uncharacterized protein [Diadema setosum]|uniref:uncharacterized protein n=1 Tax=Diadema setosum TaxID=31175 RepID=UPI003B3BA160
MGTVSESRRVVAMMTMFWLALTWRIHGTTTPPYDVVLDPSGCPVNWTLVEDTCLLAVSVSGTWDYARQACSDVEGVLFMPKSAAFISYANGLAATIPATSFWIGCFDDDGDASFECPDHEGIFWNSEVDFNGYWDWGTNEPDEYTFNPDKSCALIGSAKMLDFSCEYPNTVYPLCERQRSVPPAIARFRSRQFRSSSGCLPSAYMKSAASTGTLNGCASLCMADDECASFNLYKDKRDRNCQLNLVTVNSVPESEINFNLACLYFD